MVSLWLHLYICGYIMNYFKTIITIYYRIHPLNITLVYTYNIIQLNIKGAISTMQASQSTILLYRITSSAMFCYSTRTQHVYLDQVQRNKPRCHKQYVGVTRQGRLEHYTTTCILNHMWCYVWPQYQKNNMFTLIRFSETSQDAVNTMQASQSTILYYIRPVHLVLCLAIRFSETSLIFLHYWWIDIYQFKCTNCWFCSYRTGIM